MQLTTAILVTLSAATAVVQAQNLTGLPDCAVTCFESQLVNTACAASNTTCLCEDSTYFTDVEVCVLSSCDTTDTEDTLTWAEAACAAAGAPLSKKIRRAMGWLFGRKH